MDLLWFPWLVYSYRIYLRNFRYTYAVDSLIETKLC